MVINRRVITVVYATDDKVGHATVEQLVESYFDTIDGCTATRPHLSTGDIITARQIERGYCRKGTRITGAPTVRGADEYLSHIAQELYKLTYSSALIAVVIRYKY
jgi:hypothetical protein